MGAARPRHPRRDAKGVLLALPAPRNLDALALTIFSGLGPNVRLAWFLAASFAYYHRGESLLSDTLFDQIAKDLLRDWHAVDHPHKRLVREADLKAGTLYALPERKYPAITRGAAHVLIGELRRAECA